MHRAHQTHPSAYRLNGYIKLGNSAQDRKTATAVATRCLICGTTSVVQSSYHPNGIKKTSKYRREALNQPTASMGLHIRNVHKQKAKVNANYERFLLVDQPRLRKVGRSSRS